MMSIINKTKSDYPAHKTITELFEDQVALNFHKTALVHKDRKVSYGLLNKMANRVARYLSKRGIGPEKVAAFMLDQGIDRIVTILGILKAGGAYLPIDKTYPKERIEYMLQDSGAQFLLTDEALSNEFTTEYIRIDEVDFSLYEDSDLHLMSNSQQLMYVIYTSGSTGTPKGVMVEHRSVIRLVKSTNYIDFLKDDRMLQGCSIQFDVSIFEIWGALLNGIELHLVEKDLLIEADSLSEYLRSEQITIVWMTTPLFNNVVEQNPQLFSNLRCLLIGGDALSPKHIELVRRNCPDVTLINGYGPTENTTFSTFFVIDKEYKNNIPIGKPISNSTTYIMNDELEVLPVGTIGELCVGGDGVSRGYINKPELNAEKFKYISDEIGRVYRTGDLARMLPDGNIEFLGRADNQVKIRGFRIELNEVERAVASHKDILETLVMVKGDKTKQLYCFYKPLKELGTKELRKYLQEKLPEHMIPTKMIQISQFPYNASGKIDRKKLMDYTENRKDRDEKITPIQKELTDICKEAMEIASISIHDNFYDVGLDSLSAAKVLNKIRTNFKVDIKLRDVLENYTIESLGHIVENSSPRVVEADIIPTINQDYHEISSAQKRMYLSSLVKGDLTYNIPIIVYFTTKIDISKLKQALVKLMERHESLRTTFHFVDNSIYQRIHDRVDIEIESLTENNYELVDYDVYKYLEQFELEKAPLFSVKVISLLNNKDALLLNIHHSIFDGLSAQIFLDELMALYHGRELRKLPYQYKDFAKWHNEHSSNEAQRMIIERVWSNKYQTLPQPAVLPYRESEKEDETEENFVDVIVDKQTIEAVKSHIKENQCSIYMFFISILGVQLAKYADDGDVVITSVSDNRSLEEFRNIIGMFVETYPIRFNVKESQTFHDLLRVVRQTLYEVREHPYPFDELMSFLSQQSGKNHSEVSKLFNILMVLDTPIEVDQEEIYEVNSLISTKTSKFDLTLTAMETEAGYKFRVEFDNKLFSKSSMKKFINHYTEMLSHFAHNPYDRIADYMLMDLHEMGLTQQEGSQRKQSDYQSPSSNIEKILVDVWREVLNEENIGTNNRFFEMGGDSIKAIQIASRLQKRGFKLKVNHILMHQTISKISKHVVEKNVTKNNNLVTGEVPLTPVQKWFFNKDMKNMNHFNQSVVWKSKTNLELKHVKHVFDKLVEHHDVLRATITEIDGNFTKRITGIRNDAFTINQVSISEVEDITSKIYEIGNQYQEQLDITKGKLMHVVVVNHGSENYLIVIIHHLVIDEVSWHVLLEDFTIGYDQLINGQQISFGDKTDSYKSYSEQLIKYGSDCKVRSEREYWTDVINKINDNSSSDRQPLELTYEKNFNNHFSIGENHTNSLLNKANQAYNTQIQELLLTALAMTMNSRDHKCVFSCDMESHGRESLFEDTDVTRTVGWFTSIYPVAIPMDPKDDVKKNIIQVKETLRRIPSNGIGYGLFRYGHKDPSFQHPRPKICFNYLGVINDVGQDKNRFVISSLQAGNEIGIDYKTDYKLEMNCRVINNRLDVIFSFNESVFTKTEGALLTENYKDNLLSIIDHCLTKEQTEITPSDLSTESIDSDFMEEIYEALK